MGESYVGLLLFADNCWLIAMSPAELTRMARAWDELLEKAGLRNAWEEAVWCSSAPDSLEATITVFDTGDHSKVAGTGFQSLGCVDHIRRSIRERNRGTGR